jgi:iron complex transport system permease protein
VTGEAAHVDDAPAPRGRFAAWVTIGLAASIVLGLASLLVGTTDLATSLAWLCGAASPEEAMVLWEIRLPRSIGAWCAGALLALAGAIAQGIFRNPLADPYLLGSASGAALGVTLAIAAGGGALAGLAWLPRLGLAGAAFGGACAAIALTLVLARGAVQTATLLLAGIVVAFLLTALTTLVLLAFPDAWRAMQAFLLGTTGLLGWSATAFLAVTLAVCVVPSVLLGRGLDALGLGEDTARSLGISIARLRLALLGVMSLATATTVAHVGVVGFVGLVAPHLVRQVATLDHRRLLVAAPIAGGLLLQAADLLARAVLQPAELPVGVLTACLGGAYLVLLMWRRARDD